jgi:hypothetical protein
MSIKRLSNIFSLRNLGSPRRHNNITAAASPVEQGLLDDSSPKYSGERYSASLLPSTDNEGPSDPSMVRLLSDGSVNLQAADSVEGGDGGFGPNAENAPAGETAATEPSEGDDSTRNEYEANQSTLSDYVVSDRRCSQ